tara:strand:- start:375 stop:2375 length:2001 start_codon:yes stop_codon:yes gene_type:complete
MNPRLNKKVKKFLDAYFKGTSASSPEAHHALMFILKGALTDANFHSTSKKVDKLFPKAKNAKYFGKRDWEDSLEDKGVDIATMAKWDGHDIIDAIGFFVSMYVGGPLGKKIGALKNESFKREHKLLENLSVLVEKNVPTNPSKWSYYKSQAKKKFDVYPSAYANAWAAKQYKAAGGGWRTKKENVEEETIEEKISVFDERHFGKKGIIIMIDDNGNKISAIFKDKKNADKFNRNNPSDVKKLLQLAKAKKFPRTIDESVINELTIGKMAKKYKNRDNFISAFFKHMKKHYGDSFKDFEKDEKYRETIGKAWDRQHGVKESAINEISAEGGLKRVIKGQTREVEGIKISKEMAQAMLDWFNSSPYGRKYPKAKKGRLHLSLGIMMGFGLERYAKHKGAKDELKYIKTLARAMREDNTLRESTIKHLKSLKEVAKSKGYKPKDPFGARIIQAINNNIVASDVKQLKREGDSIEKILEKGNAFLSMVKNGIRAAFKFKFKVHPDVDFPMRSPKGEYFFINSKEDMEKYLKKFLSDLKNLDKMITIYLKKPTLKAQQTIVDTWRNEIMVASKKTGGMAYGIMVSDKSGQSMYEGKYNFKDDAMTAYMKGKISAQELDKIAKNDFKSSVATKQELQNFLKSGYMKELMANTYGLKVPAMEKKVKELMKYAS